MLQGYKNYVGLGYHANFEDSLGFARLGITAAYTPTGYAARQSSARTWS